MKTGLLLLLQLLVFMAKRYEAGEPSRKEKARNDENQEIRDEVANRDSAAVSSRIDQLRD